MIPVRFGMLSLVPGEPDEPDIYASVIPVRPFRWRWRITSGVEGYAFTQIGALRRAHRAAWR